MDNEQPVPQQPTRKKKGRVREGIETILVAFFLAIFIRATVAEARFIPSESMLPTLEVGDRLIVEKITTHMGVPKRGEILVFYPPQLVPAETTPVGGVMRWLGLTTDVAYIKRVVGLPGETITVQDGKVYINGEPLNEPYVEDAPRYTMEPLVVPEGHVFMMGDNRNNSMDSHVWGPLPLKNVIGHAVIRFWPVTRLGLAD